MRITDNMCKLLLIVLAALLLVACGGPSNATGSNYGGTYQNDRSTASLKCHERGYREFLFDRVDGIDHYFCAKQVNGTDIVVPLESISG